MLFICQRPGFQTHVLNNKYLCPISNLIKVLYVSWLYLDLDFLSIVRKMVRYFTTINHNVSIKMYLLYKLMNYRIVLHLFINIMFQCFTSRNSQSTNAN